MSEDQSQVQQKPDQLLTLGELADIAESYRLGVVSKSMLRSRGVSVGGRASTMWKVLRNLQLVNSDIAMEGAGE